MNESPHNQAESEIPIPLNSVKAEVNETIALLMPWAISFLAHFGLVLLAFFIVWSVRTIIDDPATIVPASDRMTAVMPLETSELIEISQTDALIRQAEPASVVRSTSSEPTLDPSDSDLPDVLGQTIAAKSGFNTPILGESLTFMDIPGGHANDIVYLVDASGSLIDSLPFVIHKLQESIRELNPERQRFTVIFFQRGTYIEKAPAGLQPASEALKQKTITWLDLSNQQIIPRGESTPVRALEVALRYRPDLIYILSDNITGHGRYAVDSDELLSMIERTAKQHRADPVIHTIQYLYDDPMETLRKIAERHRGVYRFVDPSYVGLK